MNKFIIAFATMLLGIGCGDDSGSPGSAYGIKFSDNLIHEWAVYNDEVSVDLYSDNESGDPAPLTAEEVGWIISVLYDTTQEPGLIEYSDEIDKETLFEEIHVVVTDNPKVANNLYWWGVSPQFIPDRDDPGYQVLDIASGFYKPRPGSYTIFVNNRVLYENPNQTPARVMAGLIVHEVTHAIEFQIGYHYPDYSIRNHNNPLFWTDLRLRAIENIGY